MPDVFIDNEFGLFAKTCNDGLHPELHAESDVILLGVSSSGKSTLSNELAKLGFKAANIAVVYKREIGPHTFGGEGYCSDIDTVALKEFVKAGKPKIIYLFCPVKGVLYRRRGKDKYNAAFQKIYQTEYAAGRMARPIEQEVLDEVRYATRLADDVGAIWIDTSHLTPQETVDKIVALLAVPHKPGKKAEPLAKKDCTP